MNAIDVQSIKSLLDNSYNGDHISKSIKYSNISINKFTHAAECIVSLHLDIRKITFCKRKTMSGSKTKALLLVLLLLGLALVYRNISGMFLLIPNQLCSERYPEGFLFDGPLLLRKPGTV